MTRTRTTTIWRLAWVATLLVSMGAHVGRTAAAPLVTPAEFRRGPEQTFLTYPEWFLVHSPAEYASFVKNHPPSDFPFIGHIAQFWQGYGAVYRATRDDYSFNLGYHVMIVVIGTSTTVEYALRAAYEKTIGRLAELTQSHGMTDEERFGARVAQDYVDFIRVRPWYEYDFTAKLVGLWSKTSWWGPDLSRKWERKYALTTEYAVKALYGKLIEWATKAGYDEESPVTAVVLDHLPAQPQADLPELREIEHLPDGSVLVTVPRYDAFKRYAATLAEAGSTFEEIAGNRGVILVSVLVPADWAPEPRDGELLLSQPILTQPNRKREVLVVPVARLAAALVRLDKLGFELEHIYDY